jgi:uncharacterized protein (UPF0276 family)
MKPLVGLLYNPAVPGVLDALGNKVDHIEVVPDRLWFDNGFGSRDRFSLATDAIEQLKRYCDDRHVIGHGIGLSLPSAIPLDEDLLQQVTKIHNELGFAWYSEHLSMFLVPGRSVPNAQAGLGLPIIMSQEVIDIMAPKIQSMRNHLGLDLLLENPTIFSSIPDQQFSEPQFFSKLHSATGAGILLDLHNLYANTVNLGISADTYLRQLDPDLVCEIHLAGGDLLHGFHTDSHSQLTPHEVWKLAYEWVPRFKNLRAITFEYHESYHYRFGVEGISKELDRMHALASASQNSCAEEMLGC